MTDLRQMSQILYHHQWTNVDDWAQNVAALADLNDDEIQQLEHCAAADRPDERWQAVAAPTIPFPARAVAFLHAVRLGFRRAF